MGAFGQRSAVTVKGWMISSGAAVLLMASLAGAQSDDAAAAEIIFNDARRLFDGGKIAEACNKFAESQRLDPSAGTLLNLARCREAEGKFASAWSAYLAAKRSAKIDGRDALAEEADQRAAEVEARLSYLTVKLEAPAEGLVVTRDGDALAEVSYGTKLPVDPDTYSIKATAPGYQDWTAEVTIGAGGHEEVLVPPLVALPPEEDTPPAEVVTAAEPVSSPEPKEGPRGAQAPIAAYAVGGTGLAVTIAGLVFGGLAASKYAAAEGACPEHQGCSAGAIQDAQSAETYALVSTVGVGVGLAGLATGVVLLILHQPHPESVASNSAKISAEVGWVSGGACAHLSGRF